MSNKIKATKKVIFKASKGDKKLLHLVKIAKEIVLREDELLLKELAKH